jgi:DNA-binding NtrC family response regulator
MERASLLSNGSVIQAGDLPVGSVPYPAKNRIPNILPIQNEWLETKASLNETLEAIEKDLIIQALKRSGGVQVEAAKLLGLNHKNLWHKIKKHNISLNDLKE